MLVGYARVSTQDQNLDLQIEALTKAGCERIFDDKLSGSRAERPGLARVLDILREGDTLVVWKLDRLGRSVKNLVDLTTNLHRQGVQFRSLTDAIDTGTPSGRFFFLHTGTASARPCSPKPYLYEGRRGTSARLSGAHSASNRAYPELYRGYR